MEEIEKRKLISRLTLALTAHSCAGKFGKDFRACISENYSKTKEAVIKWIERIEKEDDYFQLKYLKRIMGLDW
jgi:hypothetical protein